MSAAVHQVFRHTKYCPPGMYLVNISAALSEFDAGWHIHAHCVVDDFGNLLPVAFVGMSVVDIFNTGAAQ